MQRKTVPDKRTKTMMPNNPTTSKALPIKKGTDPPKHLKETKKRKPVEKRRATVLNTEKPAEKRPIKKKPPTEKVQMPKEKETEPEQNLSRIMFTKDDDVLALPTLSGENTENQIQPRPSTSDESTNILEIKKSVISENKPKTCMPMRSKKKRAKVRPASSQMLKTSIWFKKRLEENDYDPHEHRNVQYSTTNVESLLHIIKCCFGTGILTMPAAFKRSGLMSGIICTLFIITFITYCVNMLVKCQYVICKRLRIPLITYPDTMIAALTVGPKMFRRHARHSGTLLAVILVLNRFCTCAVYCLFVSQNIKVVFDEYVSRTLALEVYMLALLVPFISIVFVRNLKTLAPISVLSNIALFICVTIILLYMITALPDITTRENVAQNFDQIPLSVGTVLFAFDSVSSIIFIENNMENPKSFGGCCGVFNVAMVIMSGTFTIVGFFGYWRYGNEVAPMITLNLPIKDRLCQLVKVAYAAAILTSYGIQVYKPIQILERPFKHTPHIAVWDVFIRVICVLGPMIFAVTVPFLNVIIPLFGALCGPALQFGFPALIEFCLKYSDSLDYGCWMSISDICIIIFAILGMTTGIYSSIREFYRTIRNMTNYSYENR